MPTVKELEECYKNNELAKQELQAGIPIYKLTLKYHLGCGTLEKYKDDDFFKEAQAKLKKKIKDYKDMIRDYKQGVTATEIARKQGVDFHLIYSRLAQVGLTNEDGGIKTRNAKIRQIVIDQTEQGKTIPEIAKILKLQEGTVYRIARELNINTRENVRRRRQEKVEELKERVVELKKMGYKQSYIAKEVNLSQATISNILKSEGLSKYSTKEQQAERNKKILEARSTGKTYEELAELFDLSASGIYKIIAKNRPDKQTSK